MMQIRRVGVLSAVKIGGLIYLLLGLLVGALFACASLTGFVADSDFGNIGAGVGLLIGLCGLPIFYALIGAIFAALIALFYNLVAGVVGGLEVDLEGK
jgi:hypothetical protein